MLSERYWTFWWGSHLKYLLFFSICYYYYYYYYYYFIASWRWFLTYTYPIFVNKFFGFSSLEFFIESLYASNIFHSFFSFYYFFSFMFLFNKYIYIYIYCLLVYYYYYNYCYHLCFCVLHLYRPCWETNKIYSQGLSLVWYLYFRIFLFFYYWMVSSCKFQV